MCVKKQAGGRRKKNPFQQVVSSFINSDSECIFCEELKENVLTVREMFPPFQGLKVLKIKYEIIYQKWAVNEDLVRRS